MRLASFNLENLFDRAKAFDLGTIAEGKAILDKFGRLNNLFEKDRIAHRISRKSWMAWTTSAC
jgi:hypothetical protein